MHDSDIDPLDALIVSVLRSLPAAQRRALFEEGTVPAPEDLPELTAEECAEFDRLAARAGLRKVAPDPE